MAQVTPISPEINAFMKRLMDGYTKTHRDVKIANDILHQYVQKNFTKFSAYTSTSLNGDSLTSHQVKDLITIIQNEAQNLSHLHATLNDHYYAIEKIHDQLPTLKQRINLTHLTDEEIVERLRQSCHEMRDYVLKILAMLDRVTEELQHAQADEQFTNTRAPILMEQLVRDLQRVFHDVERLKDQQNILSANEIEFQRFMSQFVKYLAS